MRRAVVISALAACAHSAAPQPAAPNEVAPRPAEELTPDLVIAKVRGGYMTGVQRCYTRYLKNGNGHGRVLVSFTVDMQGRTEDGVASGVPAALGSCIEAEVARWQFPAPKTAAQSFALPIDLIAE